MVIEVRKKLVWATAAAAVFSAALLASSGGGPRVAGLADMAARGRPVTTAKIESPALQGSAGMAGSAGSAGSADLASPASAGPSH